MPRRPKRPCSKPGCGALVTSGRCPAHRRPSRHERGYGAEWQPIRERILTAEPFCRFCKEKGRVTAATDVDHIDGNSRNNDPRNLRPLCKSCHSRKTVMQDGGFGR